MDIFVGFTVLVLGAVIATMGLRIWFWMLPLLGFLIGFFTGAIAVTALFGDGMLSTLLGWVIGVVVGVAFMLVSWLWWYIGAIFAAASSGALIGSGLLQTFGADNRWALLIGALVGAALFALAALMLRLPIYIVVVNTAIAGAIAVVTGILLIFDQIDVSQLRAGNAAAIIDNSVGWWLLWIIIAGLGVAIQLRTVAVIALPVDRYVPASNTIRA